jgi:hypothetical protein
LREITDRASLAEPSTTASTIAPAESASSSRFARAAPSKPIERALTIDLTPPMGVVVAVDRQPALSVSTGDVLTVDAHAHLLSFSCSVCTGIQVPVASGDRDETLFVSVPIKPAILVVEGDVEVTYQMTEHPAVTVRAGTNTIALKSAFERVTVKQIETGTSVPVRLEAGKTVRVRF